MVINRCIIRLHLIECNRYGGSINGNTISIRGIIISYSNARYSDTIEDIVQTTS